MRLNKSRWISLGVQLAAVAVIVVLIYDTLAGRLNVNTSAHRIYAEIPQAWHVRCWSDAMFIPAVLWTGMGGLLWIATTGFFDIFRYAFGSLLVLFSPLKSPKDQKHYYEYKLERDEKRKGKEIPATVLIVGVLLLAGSLVLSFVHEGMTSDYLAAHPEQQIVITETLPETTNDMTGGETDE